MHRRSQGNQNLIPSNPENEATTCMRGEEAKRRKKEGKMAVREENMVLCDYAMSKVAGIDFSIMRLTIKANSF